MSQRSKESLRESKSRMSGLLAEIATKELPPKPRFAKKSGVRNDKEIDELFSRLQESQRKLSQLQKRI